MKHISILVPLGACSLSNIEGTQQIFNEVNNLCAEMGREQLFQVQLIGLEKETTQRNGLFTVNPDALITEINKTDLIIIPAMFGNQEEIHKLNAAFIPWIIERYNNGAEVASFCIGTFFLASTGLLNGKTCATHWRFVNEFRKAYPNANLVDDRILTDDEGIYTSGGAYSYTNLVIYLVEKFAGREIAIMISKAFMIDIDRHSQSPFIIFSGQKMHDDDDIKKIQDYIEHNFRDKITVDQLATKFAIGRRSLERRFKKATCNTVIEYIQRVKIESAKKSFESSRKNINEVMYDVGYADTKAFRTVFRKTTGLSPLAYRNKYNKEVAA